MEIFLTEKAKKDLAKITKKTANRIKIKLEYFEKIKNPTSLSKPLRNLPPATHRFQIGNYRLRFFIENNTIYIIKIEIRGQAYRN